MNARILIIDDEPAIGKLLEYQLLSLGYQSAYEPDPINGLQRVSFEQPDLVLLDVMMPQISGWEVCRAIRATSDVPIIMLTAKDAEADVVVGLQSGADDYVTKPFRIVQLQARIDAVLRRTTRRATAAPELAPLPEAPIDTTRGAAQRPSTPPAPRTAEQNAPFRIGPYLRVTRQSRGISLYDAERGCQVRWEYLQAIEQENWSYLPPGQRNTALAHYMRFLGVEAPPTPAGAQAGAPAMRALPAVFVVALVVMLALIVVGLSLHLGGSI
jgi:DNA-binding response OmpR family regulator